MGFDIKFGTSPEYMRPPKYSERGMLSTGSLAHTDDAKVIPQSALAMAGASCWEIQFYVAVPGAQDEISGCGDAR
jgi:hypothetical protein